jgi:hypothetical protein
MCSCGKKKKKGAACVGEGCGGGASVFDVKVPDTDQSELVLIGTREEIVLNTATSEGKTLRTGKVMPISRAEAEDLIAQGAPVWIV